MPSVANYVIIEPDTTSAFFGDGAPVYSKTFDAPDYNGENAVLTLMVKGFTAAASPMVVKINGFAIGQILPYRYAGESDRQEVAAHQFTQTCTITASIIDASTPNTLEIEAAALPVAEQAPGNLLDNGSFQDIVLLYKVDV
jgi:hypothetical protein